MTRPNLGDPVPMAVEELARCGGLPTRMLEYHHRDSRGRCVACTDEDFDVVVAYPCGMRDLATRALMLQASLQRDYRPGLPPGPIRKPEPGLWI